jgi:hypothetical protein
MVLLTSRKNYDKFQNVKRERLIESKQLDKYDEF